MVIGSENIEITKKIVQELNSDFIRFYNGQDLIGNELGDATKNVMGIAAGMLDGLNYNSLKGSLMARGTRRCQVPQKDECPFVVPGTLLISGDTPIQLKFKAIMFECTICLFIFVDNSLLPL